jgi:asparagine synthase (glutamine-hydrolysing)
MAVSRSARQHVTVSLSGDGGDELFGGYHYYALAQRLEPFFRLPRAGRAGIAAAARLLPGHRGKLLAAALRQQDAAGAFAFSRSVQKDYASVLQPRALQGTQGFIDFFRTAVAAFPSDLSPAEIGMRFDAAYTLPDEYLQKVDVASMAFSLEARDPLLDQDLVSWAMRLPLCWKLRGGESKYLLRRLAYRYVDRSLLDRPKQGFAVPIDRWLRGPLMGWARNLLNDRRLFAELPLDADQATALFDLHLSGRRNVHPLLWAVLMLLAFWSRHGRAAEY